MRASIFINYKKHTGRFSNSEKSEEADFDADKRSFVEVASEILDVLDSFVKEARQTRGRKLGAR